MNLKHSPRTIEDFTNNVAAVALSQKAAYGHNPFKFKDSSSLKLLCSLRKLTGDKRLKKDISWRILQQRRLERQAYLSWMAVRLAEKMNGTLKGG